MSPDAFMGYPEGWTNLYRRDVPNILKRLDEIERKLKELESTKD